MKKTLFLITLFLVFSFPGSLFATGFEFAVGGFYQTPQGEIGYEMEGQNDKIDLDEEFNYSSKLRPFARAKLELPSVLPNIYIMATPLEFDGEGQKTATFNFGDVEFAANVDFYSKLNLTHYDIALYYPLPFVKSGTDDKVNLDLGLNIRYITLDAEISQDTIGREESVSFNFPIPMVYVGLQIEPTESFAFEGELRGIAYNSNRLYSLIARVRYNPYDPFFIAVGYRYDKIEINLDDVEASLSFSGPFLEIGCSF